MFDDFDSFEDEFEREEIVGLVNRFEEMLESKKNTYFDQEEYENIIDYYLNNFNVWKAGKAIQHAHRLHPNAIVFLLRKAQLLVSESKTDKALEVLTQAETIDPNNSELFMTKGSVYSSLNQYEKAISEYKKALYNSDEPDSIYLNIANSYQKMGKYKKAQEYYIKCIESSNENINTVEDLNYTLNSFSEYGYHDNLLVLEELCYCFICNNDLESGIDFFTKLIDKEPYSYSSWFVLGNLYYLSHKFEEAIKAYDFAIAIEYQRKYTFVPAMQSKAKALICSGKITEAEEVFNEVIEKQHPDAEMYSFIGTCFDEMEILDKALEYYTKAIEYDPTFAESYARIGAIESDSENFQKAIEYYNNAIKYDPLNSDYYFALGECYFDISKYLEAESCFLKASRLENPHEHLWIRYSEIFTLTNDFDNAVNILKRGLSNQPENASIFYRLFCYYFYLRQFNKAEESLINALNIDFERHSEITEYDSTMELNNLFIKILNTYNS